MFINASLMYIIVKVFRVEPIKTNNQKADKRIDNNLKQTNFGSI